MSISFNFTLFSLSGNASESFRELEWKTRLLIGTILLVTLKRMIHLTLKKSVKKYRFFELLYVLIFENTEDEKLTKDLIQVYGKTFNPCWRIVDDEELTKQVNRRLAMIFASRAEHLKDTIKQIAIQSIKQKKLSDICDRCRTMCNLDKPSVNPFEQLVSQQRIGGYLLPSTTRIVVNSSPPKIQCQNGPTCRYLLAGQCIHGH